ncbi:hypothetical protein BKA66DRAFT_417040 [Pyrenochaeta sp. MPI-SDFR-AT-0127]|nr:hypothetical protein BKA66DRAFT_417040 [Pyrenochaeta sp. MPI-SDFR-AT-0127]
MSLPSTPIRGTGMSSNNIIIGAPHAHVPPSPGIVPEVQSASFTEPSIQELKTTARKRNGIHNLRTGAGVKKPQTKKSARSAIAKLKSAAFGAVSVTSSKALEKPFPFMNLPGEIRNLIYQFTSGSSKQALLVHRPRMASLRPRTRVDRSRPLASDITGNEHDTALFMVNKRCDKPKSKSAKGATIRETNRPYFGLTQVNRLIRGEYRPIYLQKQEVGMDLTKTVEYLRTFYYDAAAGLTSLDAPGIRKSDLPFTGNLTIAVGNKPNEMERSKDGIEVFPLLDLWANSFKIEAGFGRYLKAHYVPERDGEAKDLYRLFGRRVLRNRSCSQMNILWRAILRNRALASVRIHRKPAARLWSIDEMAGFGFSSSASAALSIGYRFPVGQQPKPYIHIIFKKECAEPWMTGFESNIPKSPDDWLAARGFGNMEHFDVRVGIACQTRGAADAVSVGCDIKSRFEKWRCPINEVVG